MSNSLQESMEAIAFQQATKFFFLLRDAFQVAIDAQGDLRVIEQQLARISTLTESVTGIWFEPKFGDPAFLRGPYRITSVVPNLNAFSVLNPDAVKRMEKLDLDNLYYKEVIEGWVDLKLGRVGGFFSRIRNDFEITPAFFDGHFTAGEMAAGYLHELGHCFTYYEYLGETVYTNVILSELIGRMDSNTTLQKRMWIGRHALKAAGVDATVTEDTTTSEYTAMVLEGQVKRIQRAANTRWYDHRLAEAVADQFATRWGAGADLARFLTKQEKSTGVFAEAGYEPIWFGLAMNFVSIASMAFPVKDGARVSVTVGTALKSIATSFSISMFMSSMTFMLVSSPYATIPERIKAIRRELIKVLKEKRVSAALREQTLKEIAILDEQIAEKHDWSDVYGVVSRYTLNVMSGMTYEIGQQNMTEELAHNRLYELSAALKG